MEAGESNNKIHEDAIRLRSALKRMVWLTTISTVPGYSSYSNLVETILEQTKYLEPKGPGEL